jgi:hypothetical protein
MTDAEIALYELARQRGGRPEQARVGPSVESKERSVL